MPTLGLLFYVLCVIQFCARKLLLPIVCLVLKFTFNYRVFSTKLHAHEIFCLENLEQFWVAPKSIWGLLQIQTMRATGKNNDIKERYEILFMTQRKRAGHKTC